MPAIPMTQAPPLAAPGAYGVTTFPKGAFRDRLAAFVLDIIPILIGTSFVGAFVDAVKGWQLRSYVKQLLTETYGDDPDALQQMLEALGLAGGGGFGLRLEATAARSFVRSDFTQRGAANPVLADWVANQLDLKKLAGFEPDLWWSRGWPELVGDDGDISEDDLDTGSRPAGWATTSSSSRCTR